MYKGGIKHQQIVAIPDQGKLIMTGGVSIETFEPVSDVFYFEVKRIG